MRKALALLTLLAATTLPACVDANQGAEPGCTPNSYETVDAGARVAGRDVKPWLDAYSGKYEGTLTWAAGGQTAVTVTTSLDETQPVTVQCNSASGVATDVYGYDSVTFESADGGMNVTYGTNVGGSFPEARAEQASSAISDIDIPVSILLSGIDPRQTLDTAHVAVDVSRYADGDFTFSIDWPQGAARPLRATVTFTGSPAAAPSETDRIVVATITFP
jgi:hypothetical protein